MMFPHPAILADGTYLGIAVCEFDLIMGGSPEEKPITVKNFSIENFFYVEDHEECAKAAVDWIEANDPGLIS